MNIIQALGLLKISPPQPKFQNPISIWYICQDPPYSWICSGQISRSGHGIGTCSGQNRSTVAVFRANRRSKPTSIQRVAPVGQGHGQSTSLRHVYQHTDGWYATRWTRSTRRIGDV
ncbi:hypothetical protein Natpe_4396 (plasmid) [Natrinema pellirubrum DSM 15624]|uniref:Uncharacterized protein n=1 Tax=Natrinema pellirubrum (strain DSM 15624 / CIP 106293 / JCM 10476 / NCIMB 786 / 157) TaxID=797303 RepID=L0JS61_NATP1|nr:hypothetical protein Natpe_4396 [Natrinema pellirubrum DSM 15624]